MVDCTGVAVNSEDEWLTTAASIGSHLIRLAVAQQIIEFEDLEGLVPGERFKLGELVQKRWQRSKTPNRYTPDPKHVGDMCALPPYSLCHACLETAEAVRGSSPYVCFRQGVTPTCMCAGMSSADGTA